MTSARSDQPMSAMDALEDAKRTVTALGLVRDLFWQSRDEIEWQSDEIGELLHLFHRRLNEILTQAQP